MALGRTFPRLFVFPPLLNKNILYNELRKPNVSFQVFKRGATHRPPLVYSEIIDKESARAIVLQLNSKSRDNLLAELEQVKAESQSDGSGSQNIDISGAQLRNVFLFHAIPFIGFGFLDNFIMIVAGEYIDSSLGAILPISTMAAAAMGNLISDVAGTGLAGYVEILAGRLGLKTPMLTLKQSGHWKTRWSKTAGQAIGVSVGCIIGMIPLLFYHHDKSDDHHATTKDVEVQTDTPQS